MFQSKNPYFNQVKEFHAKMDGTTQEFPKAYRVEEAERGASGRLQVGRNR